MEYIRKDEINKQQQQLKLGTIIYYRFNEWKKKLLFIVILINNLQIL